MGKSLNSKFIRNWTILNNLPCRYLSLSVEDELIQWATGPLILWVSGGKDGINVAVDNCYTHRVYRWEARENLKLNDLTIIICLRKSEVTVQRISVSNVTEKMIEHGIHCLPLWRHIDVWVRSPWRHSAKVLSTTIIQLLFHSCYGNRSVVSSHL